MGVRKGDAGCLVHLDRNGFDCRIEAPIRIIRGNFFGIQCSGLQTGYGHSSIASSSKGRAGNRFGAGRIRVQSNLPATQIFARIGFLHQLNTSGIALVIEADRSSPTGGNRNPLGIGTGAAVQGIYTGIRIPQFLDIVSASGQPRYGEFTAGIGGVWPGYQVGAG